MIRKLVWRKWFCVLLGFLPDALAASKDVKSQTGPVSFLIRPFYNLQCLEFDDGGTEEVALVIQSRCDQSARQKWNLDRITGDLYQIRNTESGKCMESLDTNDSGAQVIQSSCDDREGQKWRFIYRVHNRFLIQSYRSQRCLMTSNASVEPETAAYIGYCRSESSNQNWELELAPN